MVTAFARSVTPSAHGASGLEHFAQFAIDLWLHPQSPKQLKKALERLDPAMLSDQNSYWARWIGELEDDVGFIV